MSQTVSSPEILHNRIVSINPAKGDEVLGEVEISSEADVRDKVSKARAAQPEWYGLGLTKRVDHIRALNELFKKHRDEFAKQTSLEMGMPLTQSQAMADSAIELMDWNCAHAPEYLANKILFEDDKEVNEQVYEPYGVMACIVAWNFPFNNFVMSVSQALLAGNTVVMKYSEEVPLFEKYLETVISESDLPDGVVNFVYGDGQVGALLADQDINFLSFTGSYQTGQNLYQKAAEKFIPVALELGGSSPGIVFKDCVLDDQLIETLFWKRFLNSAQFCSNLKRLIVHNSLLEECAEKLAAYAQTKKLGDSLDSETELGPLVAERQVVKLEEQIKDALEKGAVLHCGGKRPDDLQGTFYEPTILTNISFDMRVWQEEVFGPVLPLVGFDTYEEAIQLANDTEYGLNAFVFTDDRELAAQAFLDIKAGTLETKNTNRGRSQNPFGGYKHSGIGRQKGQSGFHEVCQIKVMAWEK